MKNIIMTKTACGPRGSFIATRRYSVDDDVYKMFKADDACRPVEDVKPEPVVEDAVEDIKPEPVVEDVEPELVKAKAKPNVKSKRYHPPKRDK